jgi:ribosome biogenesis ATPase
MHVPLSAGLLLYGPPGCGKTMLAKAIANAAKANFITVKGPELLSKYVGESEESVRKVFQRAKVSAPCIIFFDEFDALAPKRQDQGNQVTERVVNTLLNELNGVEDRKMIFVIAATNRPDIIDEAILRSGRIEKHLLVPLPTPEDRVSILKAIVRKIDIGNICDYVDPDIPLEEIAKNVLCEGFSGADLHHLVKEACILAIMSQR